MAIGFLDLNNVSRVPDRTLSQAYKPNILKIQFGDGYEQRVQEGINNIKFLYRNLDRSSWKYCNKGFFNFKKYIPTIIKEFF